MTSSSELGPLVAFLVVQPGAPSSFLLLSH